MHYHRTIDDFIEAIQASLAIWSAEHSDYESWADRVHDLDYAYETDELGWNISGSYRQYVQEAMAEDYANDMYRCDSDGIFISDEMVDNHCPICGRFIPRVSADDALEYVQDLGLTPTYDQLERGLEFAWDDFKKTWPALTELAEYAQKAIEEIESADNPFELLAAVRTAMAAMHMGGTIVIDYGDISWSDIETVSEKGLLGLFDQEEIEDFLGI